MVQGSLFEADPAKPFADGVVWHRGWLPASKASALADALRAEVLWSVHRIRMFGRWVDSPRLSCWTPMISLLSVITGFRPVLAISCQSPLGDAP